MRRSFASPQAICEQAKVPRAPPSSRSSMLASSSSCRPSTKLVSSARIDSTWRPEMYSTKWWAWVPMSPTQQLTPGLGRIGAPCGLLVARLLHGFPKPILVVFDLHLAQFAQPTAGNQLAGLADHRVSRCRCGSGRTACRSPPRRRRVAGLDRRLAASGLSQMTWVPASRNALATGRCRWFGVATIAKSMPSSRLASRAAICS